MIPICLGEKNAIVPNAGTIGVSCSLYRSQLTVVVPSNFNRVEPPRGVNSRGTALCISHTRNLFIFFEKWLFFNDFGGLFVFLRGFLKKD